MSLHFPKKTTNHFVGIFVVLEKNQNHFVKATPTSGQIPQKKYKTI